MTGTDTPEDAEAGLRAGVDEAGKGPVLGSMFAACVVADPAALPEDVDDSKALSAERRETLAATIRERAEAVAVSEITVERIDDPATDMNTLTVAAHAEALSPVASDDLETHLDAGDTNAVRFERRVADRLDTEPDLRAEHGADERYPIVGAASIVAKVERDAHVADLADEYGAVGSGYPGDETTRAFLESYVDTNGHLPDCARECWQTCQDVLVQADQAALDDFQRGSDQPGDAAGDDQAALDDF
ncbi:ribonuclease HII [Halorhabdus sp. CBA1104]|uniref:ribonuclease HII n=1 Tax=unclassified Halorhabdus TaxID=2621901 RepID=UPI0012B200FD|nr:MULTISPECIES: ribonuclease HII [unclassified Halorhabdus]QGN07384.1 ribonuclease HII [Halorhabdus sp. CBA1104]